MQCKVCGDTIYYLNKRKYCSIVCTKTAESAKRWLNKYEKRSYKKMAKKTI